MKYFGYILCFLLISIFSATESLTKPLTIYKEDHFKNEVRVVNFWATWCAACKIELTEFESQLKKHPGVKLVLINLDSDSTKGQAYLKLKHEFGSNMMAVHDPKYELAEKYQLDAFPSTLIVNKSNEVVAVYKGFDEKNSKSVQIFTEAGRLVSP